MTGSGRVKPLLRLRISQENKFKKQNSGQCSLAELWSIRFGQVYLD
jgi:hypothetical protein